MKPGLQPACGVSSWQLVTTLWVWRCTTCRVGAACYHAEAEARAAYEQHLRSHEVKA